MDTKSLFDDLDDDTPEKKVKKSKKKKKKKKPAKSPVDRDLNFPLNSQIKTLKILNNTIKRSKIPHSILIYGDEATGKWELAKEIATAILCTNNDVIPSCGVCASCVKAFKNNHPDIMHISHNERYISIDEVRDIRRDIKLTPFESERRFLLIKDVDRMRHEAQNSLLKTLEEPPPSLIIVLTTARPHLLFKTIISRVMPLQLSPPPLEETVSYLSHKYEVDPNYADALYNFFMGNLKKIEEFLTTKKNRDDDTGFDYINSGIDVELGEIERVLNRRGKTDRNIILELLDDLLLRLRAMRDRLGFERFEGMAEEVITAKERISANVNINGTLTYLVESLKKASAK